MDRNIHKSRFYSVDLTNNSVIHIPTPIRSKCLGFYSMMGFEKTLETRVESDFDIINGLSQSCTPGFEHIMKESTKSELSPESYITSEPSSPEKVSVYGSSSRDLSESDDSNSDSFHQEIPSRATNPHILDDIFNQKDHINSDHKNKVSINLFSQLYQENIL